jgi:xanthine dehydrogenase accessory factor
MDRMVHAAARRFLHTGEPAVVVQVQAAQGSTPRQAGTRMLVTPGTCMGTIGGGHLELKAIGAAREMLRTGECRSRIEHYALGPALGQCCGGTVTLAYDILGAAAFAQWPAPQPLFHLQLYGAGHVGRAIATLLATLDVVVDWIDEREAQFDTVHTLGAPWPAHIRRICVDAVEAEVSQALPGAHYLVLTHSHDLDMRITEAVLRREDFGFLGLIGSKTKRQRFVRRFEQRGIPMERIDRLTCPIGVEGIPGKQPEVIAVAAVAQLLQANENLNRTPHPAEAPSCT